MELVSVAISTVLSWCCPLQDTTRMLTVDDVALEYFSDPKQKAIKGRSRLEKSVSGIFMISFLLLGVCGSMCFKIMLVHFVLK